MFLAPICTAQFVVTDNFNRANGSAGLGWSAWGNGAQINSNQLETFGEINVAGGIQRNLDVTFPLKFSFNFSTAAPSDGGFIIGFNAPTGDDSETGSEFGIFQDSGSREICVFFQTSGGPSRQCTGPVSGQRDYTATALISGTVNADFSTKITIKYNDGNSPAMVTVKTPTPAGALASPLGSVFYFGNTNETYGPHYFDNFKLSLM
jgi:hypothetical protein